MPVSSWTRALTLTAGVVLVVLAFLVGALWAGTMRSWCFGFSWRIFFGEFCVAGIPVAFFLVSAAIVYCWRSRTIKVKVLPVALLLLGAVIVFCSLSILAAEAWFWLEESAFRDEVARHGKSDLEKARRIPYSSASMVYHDGSFSAHD